MGEFFHGWRRKTGLFTLILTLVQFAGWGRSFSRIDRWSVPTRPYVVQRIHTLHGNLIWQCVSASSPQSWLDEFHNDAPAFFEEFADGYAERTFGVMVESSFDSARDQQDSVVWSWRSWGFQRGQRNSPSPGRAVEDDVLKVSYWWLMTPMTLLSAWLIFPRYRPRSSTEKPRVAEPSASPA